MNKKTGSLFSYGFGEVCTKLPDINKNASYLFVYYGSILKATEKRSKWNFIIS